MAGSRAGAPGAARVAASLLAAALGFPAALAAGPARGEVPAAAPAAVLDLGDSLSVGTAPYLRRALRGYRIRSLHDVGLHADDAAGFVARSRAALPPVLVVSAGTNDDPRIVSTFWRAVATIVAVAGPGRCVVWPTIVRPPAAGASYDGFNRVLARLSGRHRNLVLVDWAGLVARHPAWLARDGVHVSAPGYRARAAAIAAAVRFRCRA